MECELQDSAATPAAGSTCEHPTYSTASREPVIAATQEDIWARGTHTYRCCPVLGRTLRSASASKLAKFFCCAPFAIGCWPWWRHPLFERGILALRRLAYLADASIGWQALKGLLDLVPLLDRPVHWCLGGGVSHCPIGDALMPDGACSSVGRGEWLWPRDHGRDADRLPPLPAIIRRVVLYLHGGAFALCSASTHRLITFELVRRTGAVVLAPNFARPPRARFPAPLDCVLSVYRALLRHGYRAGDIVVMGDSAGGNLALALALSALHAGDEAPGGLALISPWVDLGGGAMGLPSMLRHAESDYIPLPLTHAFRASYCSEAQARAA